MSNTAPEQINQDAEFWEFIVCSKCCLPYTSNATLTVPFWLTECGHIVCNNHLSRFTFRLLEALAARAYQLGA